MAFGSVHPASTAASYHRCHCTDRVGVEIGPIEPGRLVLIAAIGDTHPQSMPSPIERWVTFPRHDAVK